MARLARRIGWPSSRRVVAALLGPRFARRLALAHGMDDIADALVSLSLVGSLFVSISFEASRGRVLQYLILTAAPLVVVAPVIGPILDRTRAGYRVGIAGSQFARAVLAALLVHSLDTRAIYPLIFGTLLCQKAYAIARATLLAGLAPDQEELVRASGYISHVGSVLGAVGAAAGGALYLQFGPEALPFVASPVYALAGLVSLRLPNPAARRVLRVRGQMGDIPADLWLATWAVAVLRAGAGALTYLLALAIKRGGGSEWVFASGLVAAGAGRFVGTVLATSILRRIDPFRLVALVLLLPGVVTAAGAVTVGDTFVIAIAWSIGVASSLATRSIDVVHARTPDLARGRVVARSEVRFQLASLIGAGLAVWFAPTPRPGLAVVAAALTVTGAAYASKARVPVRSEFARLVLGTQAPSTQIVLPAALLKESERLSALGAYRMAVVVADAAVRVVRSRRDLTPTAAAGDRWDELAEVVADVMRTDEHPPVAVVLDVQRAAHDLLASAGDGAVSERPAAPTGWSMP